MNRYKTKQVQRRRRVQRTRRKIFGTSERPRLAVYRSLCQIGCQVIDDSKSVTLASASSLDDSELKTKGGNIGAATKVGQMIAEKAKQRGIEAVVFDRRWYTYHGRIKALADAARKGGLKF